jgi:hypothetical protein
MWSISGLLAIPKDPQVSVATTDTGVYLNFKGVTQGRSTGENANYQYWDCAIWVPENKKDEWKEKLKPGNVFYVEHASATSYPVADGKYNNTKIRLNHDKLKLLKKPAWIKD